MHSSRIELTGLEVSLSSSFVLLNPTVLARLNFDKSLVMCESISVPLFLVGIIPNLGVEVMLRD